MALFESFNFYSSFEVVQSLSPIKRVQLFWYNPNLNDKEQLTFWYKD